MNWEQIKDFILEHKQYFLVGLVVVGIALWTHQGSSQNDTATEFTEDSQTEQKSASVKETTDDVKSTSAQEEPAKPKNVTCDISGAVKHQGVYTLKAGARLQELIEAAGGTASNAQLKQVNRALILQDQDKVHIPYQGEKIKADEIVVSIGGSSTVATTSDNTGSSTTADKSGAKVNLNTADAQGLQQLNGIGEKKAEQIIAYRQKNGNFKKIEDLKQVSGIGDKTFAALKDQLAV
ncbi:helix-hairpin-helix domain-containing protein [Lactobacillus sp. ESL0731]|uniref:helix-hairpin-helix domain-containing protein n=1 Tax=unclassified Lactobacillus TaxID=2620435 RepID=UPI0023F9B216|nr:MULTISPECIES: helix-hairpin-helix domain-containing protein [unclassified Lactobacillus]WEV51955.1 helix-hairpin-helix domain-containing protein [Lactobacillus sp. ESL0700]WEV63086.1 helix-hairpin-helix domain-containing protein [Lactobacillus sp. ESL0731]